MRISDWSSDVCSSDLLRTHTDWIHEFTTTEKRELRHAVSHALERGADMLSLKQADFPLPALAATLARLRHDILAGRGFALLRGIDASEYSLLELALLYRGIGAHLGEAVSQNAKGHVLGHVKNLGRSEEHTSELQ